MLLSSVQLIDLTRVSPVISRIDEFQSGVHTRPDQTRLPVSGGVRWCGEENDGRIIVITAGPGWQVRLDITIIIVGHMSRCPGNREILTSPSSTLPSLPPPNLLTSVSDYDLLSRRNFLILYQISDYFSYRVRGSENIVELLPVEIKVTFLM